MKTILANLLADTQTTYSNNGKTTLVGRVTPKVINGQNVLGSPLTRFIDTQTLASVGAQYTAYIPTSNRVYVCSIIGAVTNVLLFNFNSTTGESTYVGRVILNLPNVAATTYTARGFNVYESGSTVTLLVSATGVPALNSGIFMANKVPLTSFTPGGTNIFTASGPDQVGMYQLQDSLLYGVNNPLSTSQGVILPSLSTDPAVNTKVWQWNGTLAASQLFSWDLAVAPSVTGISAGNVSSQIIAALNNTSPAAFFTSPTNPGFNALNGDPVVLTGVAPTAFTTWSPGTLQTTANTYFTRDMQQLRNMTLSALPTVYTFTTTATTAITQPGTQYTNNLQTFTVNTQVASAATSVPTTGTGAPSAGGTLTLVANQFLFTATATIEPISIGATYTNNGQTFTFTRSWGTGTTSFVVTGTGAPAASGTLTRTSGASTGPATITFSTFSATVGPATISFTTAVTLPNQYVYTTAALSAAVGIGQQFTNNSQTFVATASAAAAATSLVTHGTGAPTGTGLLTNVANQFSLTATAIAQPILMGATYTQGANTYTFGVSSANPIQLFATGATALIAVGTAAPTASGTLTRTSGADTGPATITYSASASVATPATATFTLATNASGILQGSTYSYTLQGVTSTITFPLGALVGSSSIQGTVLTGFPAPFVMQQAGALVRTAGSGPEIISFTGSSGGDWFFNLSATSAGTAIAPTSAVSTFDVRYAFGITNSQFSVKTAPIGTFALGTILNNQNTGYCKPVSAPAAPALQGQDCIFMGTTTGLYMGLISDLSTFGYNFTIAASNVTAGAVYMNNNQYFTVRSTITGGTTLSCFATGAPTGTGNLVRVSGTGPDTIPFGASVITGNTWASMNLSGVNMLGTGLDVVAPAAIQVIYSGQSQPCDIDQFIINQSISSYIAKPYQAGTITDYWGGQNNSFLETLTGPVPYAIFNAIGTIHTRDGWLFVSQPTQVGQRGVICYSISSDSVYGCDGIISPVIEFAAGTQIKSIDTLQQLVPITGPLCYWVRSASTSTSSVFNSGTTPKGIPTTSGTVSNGWTYVANSVDIGSYVTGRFVQICLTFQVTGRAARMPPQVQDIVFSAQLPGEASDKWAPSADNTTDSAESPMYIAWRLQVPYSTTVPTLYVKGYDDAGNVVSSFNTSANASNFEYSTDNGLSWSALGTIPNTAFTTEIRLNVTTPPAVDRINWSLSES